MNVYRYMNIFNKFKVIGMLMNLLKRQEDFLLLALIKLKRRYMLFDDLWLERSYA